MTALPPLVKSTSLRRLEKKNEGAKVVAVSVSQQSLHSKYPEGPVESICMSLTANGYIKSYADFFELTHQWIPGSDSPSEIKSKNSRHKKEDATSVGSYVAKPVASKSMTITVFPAIDKAKQYNHIQQNQLTEEQALSLALWSPPLPEEEEGAPRKVQVYDLVTLEKLRDLLIAVEENFFKDARKEVTESYRVLGTFFDDLSNTALSTRYYTRALEYAKNVDDNHQSEIDINIYLGSSQEKSGLVNEALSQYEVARQLARTATLRDSESKAAKKLLAARIALSEQLEKQGHHDQVVMHYTECLKIVTESCSEDLSAVSEAHIRMGDIHFDKEEYVEALKYYTNSLQWTSQLGDAVREAKNHHAIAKCYEKTNQTSQAIVHYQKYATLAQTANNIKERMNAFQALGSLYNKLGMLKESVEALSTYHQLATSNETGLTDRKALENAQALLGIAKGQMMLTDYMKLVAGCYFTEPSQGISETVKTAAAASSNANSSASSPLSTSNATAVQTAAAKEKLAKLLSWKAYKLASYVFSEK